MDIEKEPSRGAELIQTIVALTGLPESAVSKELETILSGMGVDPAEVTLDQMREALLVYLDTFQRDMMVETP